MAQQSKPKPAAKPAAGKDPATDASAKPFEGEINPSAGQSIDDRMAALYADHVAMGARPGPDATPFESGPVQPEGVQNPDVQPEGTEQSRQAEGEESKS